MQSSSQSTDAARSQAPPGIALLLRESADLLSGRSPDVGSLPEQTQRDLLEFLRSNKVLLFANDARDPTMASRLRFPALRTGPLADLLERERRRCDGQRLAFLEAQDRLEEAGIPVVLFKSTGEFPYASSNVDALVPPGKLDEAARVLRETGHHEMVHYWEPNKRLFRRFAGEECRIVVHLHDKISWLVLSFIEIQRLWDGATSTSDPRLRHPAPEFTVAILLAHSVYESNTVSLGDLWKIRRAVSAADFRWETVEESAASRDWLPGLELARRWYASAEEAVFGGSLLLRRSRPAGPGLSSSHARIVTEVVSSGRWPLQAPKAMLKRYYFSKLLRNRRRRPHQKLWDLAGVGNQVLFGRLGSRRRPASLICVCGVDGAGKSTHARSLVSVLEECELPAGTVWLRGGHASTTERLKRSLRGTLPGLPGPSDETGKRRFYRMPMVRAGWAWLVALEQILQALLKVRLPLWRGKILIAERYVPDTVADLAQKLDDPDFQRRMPARLLRWLTPRPHLLVLLDLPGEVAFARKSDDYSGAILEKRRKVYRGLLSRYGRSLVLDATENLQRLQVRTVDAALEIVFDRFLRENALNRQVRDAWE